MSGRRLHSLLTAVFSAALILAAAVSTAAPAARPVIQWEAVPDATGYLVEVKDASGKIVYSDRTRVPRAAVNLKYGNYRARVAPLNKFGRPSSWSSWFNFNVVKSLEPSFTSVSPSIVIPESGDIEITIRGGNFMNGCRVFLSADGARIQPDRTELISDTTLRVTLPSGIKAGGKTDIVIENPGGSSVTAAGALTVTREPVIDSISPSRIRKTGEKVLITVEGDMFMSEVNAHIIYDGRKIVPEKVSRISQKLMTFMLDTSGLSAGTCDVAVVNPGGSASVENNALTITEFSGFYIGTSIAYDNLLPEWSNVIKNTFRAPDLYFGYHPDFDLPVIRHLGFEASISYLKYDGINSFDMTSIQPCAGIFLDFAMPFAHFVSLVARGGGGLQYSSIRDYMYAETEITSYDPFIYAGGSIRFRIFSRLFIESGASYFNTFYIDRELSSVRYFIRAGVIF